MIKYFMLFFCLFLISCDDKESDPPVEGCTDSSACNFNFIADIDNGSCIAPNECDLCNECDVDVGSIYLTEEYMDFLDIEEWDALDVVDNGDGTLTLKKG